MKTPVCDICRSLRVTCEPCGRKLASKALSQADFAVARALTALEQSSPAAALAEFSRAYQIGSTIVLLSQKPETLEPLLRQLSSLLRSRATVIAPRADVAALAKALAPLKFSQTQSFATDGSTKSKLLFQRQQLSQLNVNWQDLKALVEALGLEATAA